MKEQFPFSKEEFLAWLRMKGKEDYCSGVPINGYCPLVNCCFSLKGLAIHVGTIYWNKVGLSNPDYILPRWARIVVKVSDKIGWNSTRDHLNKALMLEGLE